MTLTIIENPTSPQPSVLRAQSSAPVVVFAGGGTGGHLFPALAITEALMAESPGIRFTFFGTSRPFDRTVINLPGTDLITQSVRPLRMQPWTWPGFYLHWSRSRRLCREVFAARRPAMVIGTGGFASGPPIYEASRCGIPTILLNPDAIPGRANRFLARRATRVFVQWAETRSAFPGHPHCEVTGCPIRSQFRTASRSAGIGHFGLDPRPRTLLVTGASQGATSINSAVLALLGHLAEVPGWQILHLTGARDLERVQAAYHRHPIPAVVVPFTDRMADAMAAADLVVSRAGASTLAEVTALGRPSVLLPYPYHRDMHQHANARVLVKLGAARIVHDRIDPDLTASDLWAALETLMQDEAALARMASAANRIGTTDAAHTIAARIQRILGGDVQNGAWIA
ncbi:MAG: UDP-N-acetylglucosamine--N-acetylmuramyl-(pentapeptide) pyrophosphoryl-undecaprenol N-acetylglucosamine transferase [Planctomycetota bacterium]